MACPWPWLLAALWALPAGAGELALTASSGQLLPGRDGPVRLALRGGAGDELLGCSAGQLRRTQRRGGELHAELSFPRPLGAPGFALCAAVSPSTGAYAQLTLEVLERESLALFRLPPFSRVEVRIGGRVHGPVRANAAGGAEVPVLLDPRHRVAEVVATPPGEPSQLRRQPLGFPASPQLLLLAEHEEVVGDGSTPARLWAFGIDERGGPLASPPEVHSGEGTAEVSQLSPGVFQVELRPYARAVPVEAVVSAQSGSARPVSERIRVLAGVTPVVLLSTPVRGLPADGLAAVELTVRVSDEGGRPLAGQRVRVSASAGTVSGLAERAPGIYVARYVAPAGVSGEDRLIAELDGASPALLSLQLTPPPRLTVETLPREVPADGQSRVVLQITARGPDGRPLPDGTPILLRGTLGVVPGWVLSSGGKAVAELRAGTRAGTADVEIRALDTAQTVQVRLLPGPPAHLEVSPGRAASVCGGDPLPVAIRVRDAHGNPLEGVPVAISELAADGRTLRTLGPLIALPGGELGILYQAEVPCERDRVELLATAQEAAGRAALRLSPRRAFRPSLGGRAGGEHDLSGRLSGALELELDWPTLASLGGPWASLGARVSGGAFSTTAGGLRSTGSALGLTLSVGPKWALLESRSLLVYGGAGLDGHLGAVTRSSGGGPELREVGVGLGFHLRAGVGVSAGPGQFVLQSMYQAPFVLSATAPGQGFGGLSLSAGYALAL